MVELIGKFSKKKYKYDTDYFVPSRDGEIIDVMESVSEDLLIVVEKKCGEKYYHYFLGEYPKKVEKQKRIESENGKTIIFLEVLECIISIEVECDLKSGEEFYVQKAFHDDSKIFEAKSKRYNKSKLGLKINHKEILDQVFLRKNIKKSNEKYRKKINDFVGYNFEKKETFLRQSLYSYLKCGYLNIKDDVRFLEKDDYDILSSNSEFHMALKKACKNLEDILPGENDLYARIIHAYEK